MMLTALVIASAAFAFAAERRSRLTRRRQAAARAVLRVTGVEAVFPSRDGSVFYAVAREHEAVDWMQLLDVENDLHIAVSVRASQGRDIGSMFGGLDMHIKNENGCFCLKYELNSK